jgi:exopolysaccharide production protein ExoQ
LERSGFGRKRIMLQLIVSYIVGLGPYVAIALAIGFGIPFLLAVGKPSRWLLAFAILSLCLVPLGGGDVTGGSEGSLFRQIGWGSVFLLALFYALRENGRFSIPWRWVPVPYWLLLAYALVSVTWSVAPLVSARRAVQLVGVLFVVLALVRQAKLNNPFDTFVWPGTFFLLLGVVALAAPGLSIDADGNYKGFTFTKNTWGQFALLMSLVFLFQALASGRSRYAWWLFAMASLSLLATRSATSIVIYGFSAILILYWGAMRQHANKLLPATISILLAGMTGLFAYFLIEGDLPIGSTLEAVLGSVGKTTTLTGRTELWQWMGYEIARHPWFGAGFGGFWMGLEGPSSSIFRAFSWRPGQAHNGYIDVINELGYVGFGLLLLVLSVHIWNIAVINARGEGRLAIFHLAVLVASLMLNSSETNFLRTTHLWWIVLSMSIVGVHVQARRISGTVDEKEPPNHGASGAELKGWERKPLKWASPS